MQKKCCLIHSIIIEGTILWKLFLWWWIMFTSFWALFCCLLWCYCRLMSNSLCHWQTDKRGYFLSFCLPGQSDSVIDTGTVQHQLCSIYNLYWQCYLLSSIVDHPSLWWCSPLSVFRLGQELTSSLPVMSTKCFKNDDFTCTTTNGLDPAHHVTASFFVKCGYYNENRDQVKLWRFLFSKSLLTTKLGDPNFTHIPVNSDNISTC